MIYSFIHSYHDLFIHSYIHIMIYSFIHTFIHTFIHSFIHSFVDVECAGVRGVAPWTRMCGSASWRLTSTSGLACIKFIKSVGEEYHVVEKRGISSCGE